MFFRMVQGSGIKSMLFEGKERGVIWVADSSSVMRLMDKMSHYPIDTGSFPPNS